MDRLWGGSGRFTALGLGSLQADWRQLEQGFWLRDMGSGGGLDGPDRFPALRAEANLTHGRAYCVLCGSEFGCVSLDRSASEEVFEWGNLEDPEEVLKGSDRFPALRAEANLTHGRAYCVLCGSEFGCVSLDRSASEEVFEWGSLEDPEEVLKGSDRFPALRAEANLTHGRAYCVLCGSEFGCVSLDRSASEEVFEWGSLEDPEEVLKGSDRFPALRAEANLTHGRAYCVLCGSEFGCVSLDRSASEEVFEWGSLEDPEEVLKGSDRFPALRAEANLTHGRAYCVLCGSEFGCVSLDRSASEEVFEWGSLEDPEEVLKGSDRFPALRAEANLTHGRAYCVLCGSEFGCVSLDRSASEEVFEWGSLEDPEEVLKGSDRFPALRAEANLTHGRAYCGSEFGCVSLDRSASEEVFEWGSLEDPEEVLKGSDRFPALRAEANLTHGRAYCVLCGSEFGCVSLDRSASEEGLAGSGPCGRCLDVAVLGCVDALFSRSAGFPWSRPFHDVPHVAIHGGAMMTPPGRQLTGTRIHELVVS